MYKTFYRKGNHFEKQIYKKYANLLTRVKSSLKRLYFQNKFHKIRNNPQQTWNTIRKLITPISQKVKSTISILNTASGEITDPSAIANEFNNYFVNIGTEIASSNQTNCNSTISTKYLSNTLPSLIFLEPPSVSEIFNLIHTLNLKKNAGDDEISTYILRISAKTISPLLSHLFTYVYEFGVFPSCFKTAKASPIFKTGNKTEKTNYRPIFLLSTISKVLEKTIKNDCLNFLKNTK